MEKTHYDCNKRCYPTRVKAKQKLKAIKRKHKKSREQTIYHCKKCDAWHLTSMTRAKSRNLDRWKNNNLKI